MQLDRGYRGFSFSKEADLDMRMDPTLEVSAKEIVNTWSEDQLGTLFREYGEEPRWKKAASAIVQRRKKQKFQTTTDLSEEIKGALKTPLRGKWHPATLVFQALRMCVNKELEVITQGLSKALEFLAPQGRMGVISFHSVEDRIVKNIFRDAASCSKEQKKEGGAPFKLTSKKPQAASYQEVRVNPRARSAKLRGIERA